MIIYIVAVKTSKATLSARPVFLEDATVIEGYDIMVMAKWPFVYARNYKVDPPWAMVTFRC